MAAIGALAVQGCYNPQIADGTLRCASDFSCPDGMECDKSGTGKCYKKGAVPMAMPKPPDGGTGMTMDAIPACQPPPTAPAPGKCDPVCQAGCRTGEKCNVSGPSASCVPAGTVMKGLVESCDPKVDQCRGGSICLEEPFRECGAHCYRYCRSDTDCLIGGMAGKCTGQVLSDDKVTMFSICSPPREMCSPILGALPLGRVACAGGGGPASTRPYPTFGCYILSTLFPDEAVCDCAGKKTEGVVCEVEHDCVPGLECVKVDNINKCRQLCRLDTMGPCPVGQKCTPFTIRNTTSRMFGYCRI